METIYINHSALLIQYLLLYVVLKYVALVSEFVRVTSVPLVAFLESATNQPFGFSNVALVKLLQFPNANCPMMITLLGIVILVRLLQP